MSNNSIKKCIQDTASMLEFIDRKYLRSDEELYIMYQEDLCGFIKTYDEYERFINRPDIKHDSEATRDNLWTIVFTYRDLCTEFSYFERQIKGLIKDIKADSK